VNEANLKARLRVAIRFALPRAVVYRHEDKFTGGIPDFSVTMNRQSLWIEVKYDRVGRKSKTTLIQQDALARLDGLLVRYQDQKSGAKTTILESCHGVVLESYTGKNYNHGAVARYIAEQWGASYVR
jgi:hypothetical protein